MTAITTTLLCAVRCGVGLCARDDLSGGDPSRTFHPIRRQEVHGSGQVLQLAQRCSRLKP